MRKDSFKKHLNKGKCGGRDKVVWQCMQCPRSYAIKSSYNRHIKSHEAERFEKKDEIPDEIVYEMTFLQKETIFDIPEFTDSEEETEETVLESPCKMESEKFLGGDTFPVL